MVATAEVLGTRAAMNGLPCVPILDVELIKLIGPLPPEEAIPVIEAWISNWHLESERKGGAS